MVRIYWMFYRGVKMKKIESFTINHLNLYPGLYVSRRDEKQGTTVTTFDLRMATPNKEPVLDVPAIHTIEHLGATFLRNSNQSKEIIYFGPMGCRTGFYLVMFGLLESTDIYELVISLCDYIINFEGEIPGATPIECGNYSEQNLDMAKYYINKYKKQLVENKRFVYLE